MVRLLAGDRAAWDRRLAALTEYYRPLGASRSYVAWLEGPHALVGTIRFDDAAADVARPLAFGGRLPPEFRDPRALIEAPARRLRTLVGPLAVVAGDEQAACAVSGFAGPTALYAAATGAAQAWSSHAVAAGWLAGQRVRVDAGAIPELLGAQHVGGDRTLIEGVRAMPPAVRVTASAEGLLVEDYWPVVDRWALVEEADAQVTAERALLDSLAARLADIETTHLGVTAGADSLTFSVAMRELGARFETFTFGEQDDADVRGGSEQARRLGLPFRHQPFEWFEDEDALARVHADVRWYEGALHVGFGRPVFPAEMKAWLTATGVELGRAHWYREHVGAVEHPDLATLTDALAPWVTGRIVLATHEATSAVRRAAAEWITDAARTGHAGWRLLDVVYREQREQRWGRGVLHRYGGEMIMGVLINPDVVRALVSLSLEDRVMDRFRQRFIAARAPEMLPPAPRPAAGVAPAGAPAGVIGELRHLAHARRYVARFDVPITSSGLVSAWAARPRFRDWVAEEVLGSPLVTDTLGGPWARRIRRRFLDGDALAEDLALWAGGPVALARTLRELQP